MNFVGNVLLAISAFMLPGLGLAPAAAQEKKPNILVIFGDDVGFWNVSAYNRGMSGYRTPNIDRLAKEGAIFTDYYGQQSCTAGRALQVSMISWHPQRLYSRPLFEVLSWPSESAVSGVRPRMRSVGRHSRAVTESSRCFVRNFEGPHDLKHAGL
jgi:hypothetical protein